ncbi:MAG: trypsin-like serine protease [Planctomycetes bacterium]|nr:trypsin-like serine protease [Planctomycetota bacterium]
MRLSFPALLALGAAAVMASEAPTQTPLTPPSARFPVNLDTGFLHNTTAREMVVFAQRLSYADTPWLQLQFNASTNLPTGSFVRITATQDAIHQNAVQRHDSATLAEWRYDSALFNGGEVLLELVAAPGTRANRVIVDEVTRGLILGLPESICGQDDNRVQSFDPRQGRLFVGCTGWMAGRDVMLTAGHCVSGSSTTIIEFNVPLSTSSGQIVRSHPDDQYPFTVQQFLDAGVGSDWSVSIVGRNSNTGLLPTEANGGQWYRLGSIPAGTGGQNIRITGYGSTGGAVGQNLPSTLYLVQKTHLGPLSEIRPTSLCYATDTTGGNSGSPIIHENTGDAIGVHTHAGCTSTGGCNQGTRIDRGDLQTAWRLASGIRPGTFTAFGLGCPGSVSLPPLCASRNPTGGALSNVTRGNEYGYESSAPAPLQVTGFSVLTQSNTGSPVSVTAAIYGSAGSAPAAAPLATGVMSVGTTPGFYSVTFPTPVTVPTGSFYVAVWHNNVTLLANVTSGDSGRAFYRSTPGSGNWLTSGLVTRPSFQVLCQRTGNAIPAIAGTGAPETGGTFEVRLSQAVPNQQATLFTGFSNRSWQGGSLPFSLAGIGAPGCSLLASTEVNEGAVTNGNGEGARSYTIPTLPALVGAKLYHQWLVVDPGVNTLGVVASDGLETTIGG